LKQSLHRMAVEVDGTGASLNRSIQTLTDYADGTNAWGVSFEGIVAVHRRDALRGQHHCQQH